MTAPTITDLVPSLSIDNLLQKREAMIERVRSACRLLGEVQDLASVFYPDPEHCSYRLSVQFSRTQETFTAEGATKEIDAHAWQYLLERSGLQTFLDAAAREKWRKAIDKLDVPPLTRENIQATFRALYDTRGEMFERGVLEVYRKLSWEYRTNTPVKFGRRLILRSVVEVWGHGEGRHVCGVSHRGSDELDDLIRVLSVLDEKPEPDSRQGVWRRCNDVSWMRSGGSFEPIDLGYFTVRGFKNGNGHLTFKRQDLVDRMNAILAKHHPNALAPAREDAAAGRAA